VRAEEGQFLIAARTGAVVDVVCGKGNPRELGVGVGILFGESPTGQHADSAPVDGLPQAGRREGQGVRPGSLNQLTGLVADQRRQKPVSLRRVLERPAALVAVPLFVDLGVVAGQAARDAATPPVASLLTSGRAVLAYGVGRLQVERPGPESVLRPGECTDRTDLHGVAGEVGLERLFGGRADLLLGAPLEHVDERIAGNLLRESRASLAQHAPLAVEQHVRRDRDRLGERALRIAETRVGAPVAHRLVLQWALAALVADRAVERMVDQ
jgi:hypothetical protein